MTENLITNLGNSAKLIQIFTNSKPENEASMEAMRRGKALGKALTISKITFDAQEDAQEKETKREVFNPLVEALFMTMRGHNNGLLNPNEPNEPACAQGAYLQLLQALGEVTRNEHMQHVIAGTEIDNCGDVPA